jgi:seryl-tRNA synthetase
MGKAVAVIKEEPVLMQDNSKEDAHLVLQKLSSEEANLIEEKQNLASLKEKLQMKIREKIEGKKNNIQKLRDEIKELKFSCEELTQTLKVGT